MPILILIILAIVQGATEFLPVSSSGHLVLLYNIFGIHDDQILLTILLHVATLVAVIIYYRKELISLLLHPFCPTNRKIAVSTITTAIMYLALHKIIERAFDGRYLFACFIVTAILLLVSEYLSEKRDILTRTHQQLLENLKCDTLDITDFPITYGQAIVLGLAQGVAILPGISRSGSTIAVGSMMGVKYMPTYSFIMSIPVIVGSLILELVRGNVHTTINPIGLILSMVICAVVGYLSIRLVDHLGKKNKLSYFAYYLIALSTVLVVLSFI